MTDVFYDYLQDSEVLAIVNQTSIQYGNRYRAYGFEVEDCSQQLLLWLWDHPEKVMSYIENGDYGYKQIATALHNEAREVGEAAKAQHLGYSTDDLVYYSKGQIKELLPSVFDEEAWLHPEQGDVEIERRKKAVPAEGGNWIATLADISRAFESLSLDDKKMLWDRYRAGSQNRQMAKAYGLTEQVMSYRVERAIKRLLDALGGPRPKSAHDADCSHDWRSPWVGRTAYSNAAARAQQASYWEDDE